MKYVVCYSGGLDSTVLLKDLSIQGHEVHALSVDYGQRHVKELHCAKRICEIFSIPIYIAPMYMLKPLFLGSSQTDKGVAVPEGHYAEESMKATVVPNRNMILLSLAAAWAISLKADGIAYAAHAGDHAIYPDCRTEFVHKMREAFQLCDWHKLELYTPFAHLSKTDIVRKGNDLKVPFEKTYSCYKGKDKHCGRCGTCVERSEAFKLASVPDPTIYED